jgi:hypothetical protein
VTKSGKDFNCETCHAPADHLSMSYTSGAMECDACSLTDEMSDRQRKRIELRIKRSQLALRNFHQFEAA